MGLRVAGLQLPSEADFLTPTTGAGDAFGSADVVGFLGVDLGLILTFRVSTISTSGVFASLTTNLSPLWVCEDPLLALSWPFPRADLRRLPASSLPPDNFRFLLDRVTSVFEGSAGGPFALAGVQTSGAGLT